MHDPWQNDPDRTTRRETPDALDRRIAAAKAAPGVAHLILGGPSPTCELCGGTSAPIIDGRHLAPERFCER